MQEVDMAMGGITRTGIRATAVDFSQPTFVSSMGLVSRKPAPLPKYLAILWPYTFEMWLLIVIAMVVTALVYYVFSKLGRSSGYGINLGLWDSCTQITMVLLLQSKCIWHLASTKFVKV